MAVPVSPTATSLVTEALKKAGYSGVAVTDRLTRATDEWLEEIKNDVFNLFRANRIKSLQVTSVMVCTIGQGEYADPDEASDLSMQLMDGTISGVAQAGALNSITLAAAETITQDKLRGKEILIQSGTGIGSLSQVTAYNESTKVATMSPNFNTAPASGSVYSVIDKYDPITKGPLWEFAKLTTPTNLGKPEVYYPKGHPSADRFYLYKVPDKSYGIKQFWYADISKLDLAGAAMASLYRKWRNMWVYGVYWKALDAMPDNRAPAAQRKYEFERNLVLSREIPGFDMSNLQCTVSDY